MYMKLIFLKQGRLPNIYRYLYFRINDTEFISFYKFTRTNKVTGEKRSQRCLQIFNKEIGCINVSE